MNGAEVTVQMLLAHGVKHVFGVPGDTTMPLYDAFHAARGELTHVMARDERSAGFMADAYARLAYKPGICEAPSGGGATYSVPGVAEANGSSIPVICLTTDIPLADEDRGTLTALDQELLFKAVVKWNTTVKRAANLPDALRRAFRMATTGRPGAVHVVLPEDVLVEEVGAPRIGADPACRAYPAYRVRAGADDTRALFDALVRARRPAIVAGGGVVISQAWDELTELATLLRTPVGTTINGKGSIAEDHPWSIGVIGGNGGRPYANELLGEADTILYVGSRVNSLVTLGWRNPAPEDGRTILQIDADPWQLGNNLPVTHALCGDAKLVLADLVALAREFRSDNGAGGASEWTAELLRERARGWWDAFEIAARSDNYPVKPQRIFQLLERLLPPASVIVADPGTMTPFTAGAFAVRRPGRSIVIPRAHGGLGYAIPAVVGAHFARPHEPVVGLVGDGSFGMSGTELETIGRLRLPVTLVHFNNGTYGWIKMLQHLYFDDRFFGVDFSATTDYVAIAEGFGVRGIRVAHPDQLGDALATGLRGDGPTFIDVATESELVETPPVEAWQRALAASGR